MPSTPHARRPLVRRARALLALLALLAPLLWLAGCGGSESGDADDGSKPAQSTGGGSGSAGSADSDAGRVRLAECLRRNGADVPDDIGQGGTPPRDLDADQLQRLLDGPCKAQASSAFEDAAGGDSDAFRDAFAVYAQCMRDNGVDLPDLPTDGSLPDVGAIDRDAPSFVAAQQACASKLPQGLPGGGQ